MWPRFTLDDIRVVAHFLGIVLIFLSAVMLIPFVVALLNNEFGPALDFFLSAGISLFAGSLLRLSKIRQSSLNPRQAIMVTGVVWIVVSFFGAIPLMLSGHYLSFLDAFFDTVAGFTTTGFSLAQDLNHLSYAHTVWRLLIFVMGGQGIIAIAMTIGIFARSSGAGTLYKSEAKGNSVLPNIIATVRFAAVIVFVFIGIGTVLCTIACMTKGISLGRSFYHSICLASSAFVTGGFAPLSTGIIYYHSFLLETILMVLMIAGTLNFALYFKLWEGDLQEFKKNVEVKALAIWIMAIIAILSVAFAYDPMFSQVPTMLRRGVFTGVAALTNTGFSSFYPAQIGAAFSSAILFAYIMSMALGGSTGSTSGGIKALRLAIVFKTFIADIKRALSPDSAKVIVKYHHFGNQILGSSVATGAMIVVLLFIISYVFGAIVGVAFGYEPIPALFESVSATSNAGLSTGITSPTMPLLLKITYIIQMWAGRLEFLTILALIAGLGASIKNIVRDRAKQF